MYMASLGRIGKLPKRTVSFCMMLYIKDILITEVTLANQMWVIPTDVMDC